MGQLFSSNKNDSHSGIFTGSSNFSSTPRATYTIPNVQPKTDPSKTILSHQASSCSSSARPMATATSYSYIPSREHAIYSSNPPLTTEKRITAVANEKIIPMFYSSYKSYGYYECDCGAWWESAHSWAEEPQDCKSCGNEVFPYYQEELKPREEPHENSVNKPHREDLCGMCKKLGFSCTIIMEPSTSYYAHQKPDVRVKGLPNDITENKIRKMFASYGAISRVNILKPDPRFSTRVAFITFDDPEAVVNQFKRIKQLPANARRIRR